MVRGCPKLIVSLLEELRDGSCSCAYGPPLALGSVVQKNRPQPESEAAVLGEPRGGSSCLLCPWMEGAAWVRGGERGLS